MLFRKGQKPHAETAEARPAGKIMGFLLVWTVILFALATAVYSIAGNGELLARDMFRFAPPEMTGLPGEEYRGVGEMTAGYLTGREAEFQYTCPDQDGNAHTCFQPHEAAHMADCRGLIRLAGILRWILGGMALCLAGTGAAYVRDRKGFAAGMFRGLAAAGAVFGLLAAWCVIDFDGAFVAFHRIAFTNDGWLLDSRTDLLIRLMPTDFFIVQGLRVLAWTAATALAALGVALILRSARRPQGSDE